ncbi:MAG: Acg family FMN-binding oxidoreductase [Marinobacterium sp.]
MAMLPDPETLKSLLHYALLAPSSHNTQPWLFRLEPDAIQLHADRERALQINDPAGRELYISGGCALMSLRVAAAHAGWGCMIELFPDAEQPDYLAHFKLTEEELACDLSGLFDALLLRRTYRNHFRDQAPDSILVNTLQQAATLEGAQLTSVSAEVRDGVIELVREGDGIQWHNEAWRDELAHWLHAGGKGDGLPVPGLVAPLVRGMVRHFDMGRSLAWQDELLAAESPLILLLSTRCDSRGAWLRAGQALQRVLLEAQRHGVQASYLNQPIQVAELRPRLERLIGTEGHAQILLRLGYPQEVLPATLRRSLQEVIRP